MSHRKKKSPWSVLIAIALAVVVGSLSGKDFTLLGVNLFNLYDILGKLFINALTLVVVPLVSASIITGIARIGNESDFGRLGIKTFIFYMGTSFIAIVIGVIMINIFNPGLNFQGQAAELMPAGELAVLKENLSSAGHPLKNLFLDLIPPNVLNAFAKGNMLGLIFFSLLFGYALTRIKPKNAETHMKFWTGIFEGMIHITHIIMRLLPIGVFCLVAKVFAETGLESLQSLGLFFITVLFGLGVFVFIALPLLLKFIARVNPLNQFRVMAPALITAFSTSSSSAALPITLDCMEKRGGISNRICSLVIPLGTTINLSGSALYEGMAALFVAQAYGLDLSFTTQLFFTFVTLLTSMGVASIPSGSLVAIIVILKAMGLPAEGIGLFIAVDRLLDMCRSTVNVFSDSVCATLVAATEGEKDILTRKTFEDID